MCASVSKWAQEFFLLIIFELSSFIIIVKWSPPLVSNPVRIMISFKLRPKIGGMHVNYTLIEIKQFIEQKPSYNLLTFILCL